MLKTTIPAYPFREYADDDNIRSFFDMFNVASQQYLDWFNQVGLPYYPGLSGELLQWVGIGLYGVPYYNALQSSSTPAVGPLNTANLNTIPLDFYSFPTETFFQVTDDVYKRIITWNFYKGDGKRFCPRWLKRRIMRFIVGTNGIDPQPWNDDFVVGCENTTALSVQFSGTTCTITLSQLALSAMLQLAPNILTIFKSAFLAPGVLEKPIEWDYVVDIETSAHALVSPLSLSVTSAAAAEVTGAATVSVLGGSGSYTYAWSWLSGGAGIGITSPTARATTFSTTTLTPGVTQSGVAQCVVTDTVTTLTTSCALPVSLARVSLPVATPMPASLFGTGATDNITSPQEQVTGSGGGAPYQFLWTWQSGGAGIGIDSPFTSGTTFTAIGVPLDSVYTGVALCTMTDAYGQVTTCTVLVEIARASAITAAISPGALTVTAGSSSETTGATTVTASGGVPPYGYSWGIQSGAGISPNSPLSPTTTFTAVGLIPNTTLNGVAQCTVKDSVGQQAIVTCNLTFARESTLVASVLPVAQNSSGGATTQSTGASTVTASGGTGPYTYAWRWSSGGTGITINTPIAASTNFTAAGMAANAALSGVAQCTVTDVFGQTAQVTVAVMIQCLSSEVSPTVTAATTTIGAPDSYGEIITGYSVANGLFINEFGSISSHSIPPGQSIFSIFDVFAYDAQQQLVYSHSLFIVFGFSADPGQTWLTEIDMNGITHFGNTASGYNFADNGSATWSWTTAPFAFSPGVPRTLTIAYVP